jgi:hypothetical protein
MFPSDKSKPKVTPTPKVAAKPKVTPSPVPSTFEQKSKWTENEFRRLMKSGVPISKARDQASKKYNISPNGFTN